MLMCDMPNEQQYGSQFRYQNPHGANAIEAWRFTPLWLDSAGGWASAVQEGFQVCGKEIVGAPYAFPGC